MSEERRAKLLGWGYDDMCHLKASEMIIWRTCNALNGVEMWINVPDQTLFSNHLDPGSGQICVQCNIWFCLHCDLKQHFIFHTGEKPYDCAHILNTLVTSATSIANVLLIWKSKNDVTHPKALILIKLLVSNCSVFNTTWKMSNYFPITGIWHQVKFACSASNDFV